MNTLELEQLTADQKRIRIAEACGWKISDSEAWRERSITDPSGKSWRPTDPRIYLVGLLPDYLGSLDAIQRAVLNLDERAKSFFGSRLQHVVLGHDYERLEEGEEFQLLNATAPQRADAFLLALEVGKNMKGVS